MRLAYFVSTAIIISSCTSSGTKEIAGSKFDIANLKDHIDEANKEYGERFNTNDTAFYAARYCKDAVLMPEQVPQVVGRDSIRHFFYNNGQSKGFKIAITATSVYGSADAVIEEGYYIFPGENNIIYDKGKFMAIWKQEDGKWKLYREIWCGDAPPKTK